MNAVFQLSRIREVPLELLAAALAAAPESVAIVEDGIVIYANPAFVHLYGYDNPLIAQGKPLSDFVPGVRACTRPEFQYTHKKGEPCGYSSCDFEIQKPNGGRAQLQSACAPVTFPGRNLLVLNLRDISHAERRRLVRESDARFRAVVDEAAIGILQCSVSGKILESNPAAERILGYTSPELRGAHFHDFIHPDDRAAGVTLLQDLLKGGSDHYRRELRFQGKNSDCEWARLAVSLVRGPDTKPAFVILMIEDVTECKRAEQQLRESHKMEAIGRLAGGVAHDFNNLLTGIMLYSDLLKAGLAGESRLASYVDEIHLASEHGGALIQQLLGIAKRQVVQPRILSLNEVVSGMQNLLSRLIGEHIAFKTDFDPDLGQVLMDPTQVQQILLNLAINARDAMPDGGTILVTTRNVGRQQPQEACVELTVQDDGCGMSPETLSHVFEPFFTTKSAEHGNGLGLSTVQNIIRESGGSIDIASKLGAGTRIVIRLPLALPDKNASSQPEPHPQLCGGETILLVEDNESVRRSAKRILRRCGYRVLEAATGKEALGIFQRQHKSICLLLSDLRLPDGNGREIARQIQQLEPTLPVIFTTGYEAALDLGSEQAMIIRKPFAADALAEKIRQVLDSAPQNSPQIDQKRRKTS